MIDISGLVKVKPMHPGPYEMCFGKWWYSIVVWMIIIISSTSLCTLLLWFSYEGNNFIELIKVIAQVIPPVVLILGGFCELFNWHNWKMRKALYLAGLKEDYQERRMVL